MPEDVSGHQASRLEQRISLASATKDKGNALFKAEKFEEAAQSYIKAYKLLNAVEVDEEHAEDLRTIAVQSMANLGLVYFRMGRYQDAVKACDHVLELDPHNEKALFRRGSSLKELGKFDEAHKDFKAVLSLNGKNQDAIKLQKECLRARKEQSASSSEEYMSRAFEGMFSKHFIVKSEAPYAGLRNEGATCYLNSVLQILFHLPAIRRAIFQIPTSPSDQTDDSKKTGVMLALQRLLYRMEVDAKEGKPSSATELIASFGWDTFDTLTQQDVGEFVNIFLETIEENMKETSVKGEITRLCGLEHRYFDRIHKPSKESVKWLKTRDEPPHWPLMIHHIRECHNISEALKSMTGKEIIDGYNTSADYEELKSELKKALSKGDTEKAKTLEEKIAEMEQSGNVGFGVQQIERSLLFKRAPPILIVNLQRVQFSPTLGIPEKINSRFEFPEELDLTDFMDKSEPVDPTGPSHYLLHSVVVHSGYSQGGHYYAYIRPDLRGREGAQEVQWYKFDDDQVRSVSQDDAMSANFGGENSSVYSMVRPMTSMRSRSAYMLVYLKSSCLDVLMDTENMNIPTHVMAGKSEMTSLPSSVPVLLPDGHGVAGPKDGRSRSQEESRNSNGRKSGSLRGALLQVPVANIEECTVGKFLELVRSKCKSMDCPLDPPSVRDFVSGIFPRGSGRESAIRDLSYKPELKLCLTQLKDHEIVSVFSDQTMLSSINSTYLLRLEWIDENPDVLNVPVFHHVQTMSMIKPTGDPCIVPVFKNDKFEDVMLRVAERSGIHVEGDWQMYWNGRERELQKISRGEQMLGDDLPSRDPRLVILHEQPFDSPSSQDFLSFMSYGMTQEKGIRIGQSGR
uniref:Ubiquitin carboxyl-terminal hydrolase n=1 Tax=Hanusia phi TaxID=3032 RepID=A0A7S0I4I2_9CRYP|mmetsp:Transcript_9811/g.22380  ORF Transcript_9811/g.22380 Transcript_9811/m.22380 type:complete len:853 (+) Transcript_9811:159-2717(+)